MSKQRLRVFVSSKMQELTPEREAVKAALGQLLVEAFVFEKDAGARPQTIRQTYLDEVEAADLYIGLFWKGYGAYTIEEYEHAQTLGMDCFIYEKRDKRKERRNPDLQAFLNRVGKVESGLTVKWFYTPAQLRIAIKEDVAAWQTKIVRERKSDPASVFVGVPPKPNHFLGRGELMKKMVAKIQSGEELALAVEGLPGVGKTTLAVELAYNLGVRRRLKDGVLWAGLGRNAAATDVLVTWANALLERKVSGTANEAELAQVIRDAIGQRQFLVVIDDAWDSDTANALRCGGPNCYHLLTTRDKGIARAFAGAAAVQTLPVLNEEQAYQLLSHLAPEACAAAPASAQRLARAVDGLPLALSLVGGYLAAPERSLFPDLSHDAFHELEDPLHRLQLAEKRIGTMHAQKMTLQETIALSLEGLPRHAVAAFYSLGAFAPKPAWFSREAAEAVTQADAGVLALLAARNLLEIDTEAQNLTVHQIVADVAFTFLDETAIGRHSAYYSTLVKKDRYDYWKIADHYPQLKRAWQSLPNDASLLDWLSALSHYQRAHGLWGEHLDWAHRALAAVREGQTKEKGTLLANISSGYHYLAESNKALEFGLQALPLLEHADRAGFARILHNLGVYHHALGQEEKALDYLKRSLPVFEEADDLFGRFICYLNAANVYTTLGKRLESFAFEQQGKSQWEGGIPLTQVTDVALVFDISIEREVGSRSPFLIYLHQLVLADERTTDFDGTIVIGVKRVTDQSYEYWYAVFSDGKKARCGFADFQPFDADLVCLLGGREAYGMLLDEPVDHSKTILSGDLELLGRFREHYLIQPPNGGLETSEQRAVTRHNVGYGFFLSGQLALAVQNYDEAIELRTRLLEQEHRSEIAKNLAESFDARGDALSDLKKPSEAIEDFGKAIVIRTKLVERESKVELAGALASSLCKRAIELIALAKVPEAVRDLDKAIEMKESLCSPEDQGGRVEEMATTYGLRATLLKILGKRVEAIRDFGSIIEIVARSLKQEWQPGIAAKLAEILVERATLFHGLDQPANAVPDYGRAIEIYTQLVNEGGLPQLSENLGKNLVRRAQALYAAGQVSDVMKDCDKAVEVYSRLVGEKKAMVSSELASLFLFRGLLNASFGHHIAAGQDYDRAVESYSRLVEQEGRIEFTAHLADSLSKRGKLLCELNKVAEAIQDCDKAVRINTKIMETEGGDEAAKALAAALSDRGQVFVAIGRALEGVQDLGDAARIYTPLVENRGNTWLTLELAGILNQIAWLYATSAEDDVRDGSAAVENARRACELTAWTEYRFFDTLGTAFAEAGNFDQAVQWQRKALDVASEEEKADFHARLELYQTKKPFREQRLAQRESSAAASESLETT